MSLVLTDVHGVEHVFSAELCIDRVPREKLGGMWFVMRTHPVKVGRALFPGRPVGYVSATYKLASYAINRAAMLDCRARGDRSGDRVYRTICEGILSNLPPFAARRVIA